MKFAVYLGISLVPALVLHEYAHAFVAVRLGDPTAKRWGRLTLNPRPLIDPFGSLILVAARGVLLLPVFAYAKPMPVDPTFFKNPRRDMNLVVLAGLFPVLRTVPGKATDPIVVGMPIAIAIVMLAVAAVSPQPLASTAAPVRPLSSGVDTRDRP